MVRTAEKRHQAKDTVWDCVSVDIFNQTLAHLPAVFVATQRYFKLDVKTF